MLLLNSGYAPVVYKTTRVTRQANTTQHEAALHNTSTTSHNTSTARHNTRQHEKNTRQHEYNTIQHEYNTSEHEYKESSGSKNGALLHIFCYWTIYFLLEMVDIVLHAILFQPFEYQGVYTSFWGAAKQPGAYDVCAGIGIQMPGAYIYLAPFSCFIGSNCGFWPTISYGVFETNSGSRVK